MDDTYQINKKQLEFFFNTSKEFVAQGNYNISELYKKIEQDPAILFDFVIKKARESGDNELKIDFLKALAFRGYQSLLNDYVKITEDISSVLKNFPGV
jgi:hypothetical protein